MKEATIFFMLGFVSNFGSKNQEAAWYALRSFQLLGRFTSICLRLETRLCCSGQEASSRTTAKACRLAQAHMKIKQTNTSNLGQGDAYSR
jgi:hypothetical protein